MKRYVVFSMLLCALCVCAQHRGYAIANTPDGEMTVGVVQLRADGPWFAELNVGATHVDEVGGYYTWGGEEIDKDSELMVKHAYPDQNIQRTDEDVATQLLGEFSPCDIFRRGSSVVYRDNTRRNAYFYKEDN